MAEFDFTTPAHAADSTRWGKYAGRDVLPLWLADMDFVLAPALADALRQRIDAGPLAYARPQESLTDAVIAHCQREYGWAVQPQWLVWLPGLVSALHVACRGLCDDDAAVFTTTPVYPPFLSAPTLSRRRLLTAPLVRDDGEDGGCWRQDFAAADALMRQAQLLLLCHPHNPVGRVWGEDELWQIAALAEKHDLVVCSDEIHCDLTLGGRHRPFASLAPEIARRSITLMSTSKTFNTAGLGCAWAVIANDSLRRRFEATMRGIVPHVGALSFVACEAALRHGGGWRRALLETLRAQAAHVEAAVNAMPGLSMSRVEATFLAWIDCSGLGVDDPAAFFEAAGVGLSAGADFGPGGARHVRLNFAVPRSLLDTALARMRDACASVV